MQFKVTKWIAFRVISIFLGIICLCTGIFPEEYYGSGRRVVKVAFFPMEGYHIKEEDGSYGGMDVEYLDAVSEYAGWDVQYVECESWEEALQLLSEKKVDLVGSAQYSAERAQIYQYADLSSGYTFGVIATKGDSSLAYEDFRMMRRVVFGMVKGYVRKNEFLQYLRDNDVLRPEIVEYENTAQLHQALEDGEIGAFVHTFTEVKAGQRLVGRFAPRPFYYISYPGNDDVMRELNKAVADLKMNRPQLETDLLNKYYYDRFDKAVLLTTEEEKYLKQTDILHVGYIDGHYPFSYKQDGEFTGLAREMLEASFSATGQRMSYLEVKNEEDAEKALADGKIDLLAYCMNSAENLRECQLEIAKEYASVPLVLVMDRRSAINDIKTVAVTYYLKDKVNSETELSNVSTKIVVTQEECLEEVASRNVDAALCDGYLAENLFRTDLRYEDLQIKNVYSSDYPIYVAVRKDDDLLSGILAKMLTEIDSKMVSEYMLRENVYPLVSIGRFVREHSMKIILFLLAVVVLIIAVGVHMIRDEKKIRKLMYKDTTLDIWNMNYMIYWGSNKLLAGRKKSYAAVYVNLSQFRLYNTIYGWGAGERLLREIVEILKELVDEKTEICARDQGDRFVLLLCYSKGEELRERLKEIRDKIEQKIFANTGNRMLVRGGVYLIPPEENDLKMAVSYAEQAFEVSDSAGENTLKIYDTSLALEIKERHDREKLLESVDIDKDFVAYYQPKVDIRTGKIVGAEALIRFLNPAEGGAVKAPGFFVPYYEQTGRVTEIDFFVYKCVCRLLHRRLEAGEKVVPISCNFSRIHFFTPGFTEKFEEVINQYQVPKELVEVEITETIVLEELQQNTVMKTLDNMHHRHIRLSIDDFGSGYSSLGVFEQIPASVIKLDRSFLLNQKNRERQVAVMRGIVKLADELNAQIVCEGVETDNDVELMREIGANVAQGYYYSKPIPEDEFEAKLNAQA